MNCGFVNDYFADFLLSYTFYRFTISRLDGGWRNSGGTSGTRVGGGDFFFTFLYLCFLAGHISFLQVKPIKVFWQKSYLYDIRIQ